MAEPILTADDHAKIAEYSLRWAKETNAVFDRGVEHGRREVYAEIADIQCWVVLEFSDHLGRERRMCKFCASTFHKIPDGWGVTFRDEIPRTREWHDEECIWQSASAKAVGVESAKANHEQP